MIAIWPQFCKEKIQNASGDLWRAARMATMLASRPLRQRRGGVAMDPCVRNRNRLCPAADAGGDGVFGGSQPLIRHKRSFRTGRSNCSIADFFHQFVGRARHERG